MLTIISVVSSMSCAAQGEHIDEGEVELRHPPVVLAALAQLAAADGAAVFVIVEAGIPKADACLQLPSARQVPLVAIAYAGAVEPSLAVVLLQRMTAEGQTPQVELPAVQVDAEIMSFVRIAQPVAHFGLHQPVLPLLFAQGPAVVVAGEVERPAWG